MDNNTNKVKSLIKRIRIKSLPFDEAETYNRLIDRINNPVIIPHIRRESNRWKYMFAAASVALLIVSTITLTRKAPEEALVYYETMAVPDAKTKIVLPDSSIVWLNANTSLRYPREFSGQTREVSVDGEAFFEVRKDDKKPFIVQSDGINIRVLGTSFNIDAWKNTDKIEITLLKGKIALFNNLNKSDVADLILHPGERALFSKSQNKLDVGHIRAENAVSWVTGEFMFKENTLEDIIKELSRAFHVKIHIENNELRRQTFNADFKEKETLDEILSILQIAARYKITKQKGEIFLK